MIIKKKITTVILSKPMLETKKHSAIMLEAPPPQKNQHIKNMLRPGLRGTIRTGVRPSPNSQTINENISAVLTQAADFLFEIFFIFCYALCMKKLNLQNIVWKEGKYYVSQCLNVDISSFGKTKKEALKSLSEALDLYFEEKTMPKFQEVKSPELFQTSFTYA